jgi:hypothetical protein
MMKHNLRYNRTNSESSFRRTAGIAGTAAYALLMLRAIDPAYELDIGASWVAVATIPARRRNRLPLNLAMAHT